VFSAFWLGMVILGFLIGVVAASYRILTGHFEAAGGPAALSGATMGFALFFVGLTTFARWMSRDEVTHLRSWLVERLQSQG
jgi:hypothetical protein